MFSRSIGRICFVAYCLMTLVIPSEYKFMLLNLILAFIPYELSYQLKLFKPESKSDWPLFILMSIIFVLMSPNIFYVVTDLIHLNLYAFDFLNGLALKEWLDFMYLLSGVMIALYFYSCVLLRIERFQNHLGIKITMIIGFMVTTSLGIYIGRFLRFHSVHILTHPVQIIRDTLLSFNMQALLWMMLLTCLQLLYWLLLKGVRRA